MAESNINNMGLFKHLGDAFSGKIEKHNILIGRNVNRVVNYVPASDEPTFIKNWIYACTIDIQATLEMALPIGKDIKPVEGLGYFSENINLFDEQKVFQIFKLLCGYHLFIFLKNENNTKFLNEIGLSKENFENKIFNIFEFTKDDKSLYLEFSKLSSDDVANYALNLWDEAMKICFGKDHKSDAKMLLILCTVTMSNYGKIFYPTLIDIIKK